MKYWNNMEMGNQQLSTLNGESSTTSQYDVPSSDGKWGALFILINNEDIVWSSNENLKKFHKKYNYIYKTTCLVTNKYYIGRHSTNNIKDGYMGSGKVLKNSIKKYGRENFKKEFLYFCKSLKDLIELEKTIVNECLITNELCMNLVKGGLNPIMIGNKNPNYKKPISEKQRKTLSDIAKTKTKDKNPFYGKKHSIETRKKISEKASRRTKDKNGFYGKKHSTKTKNTISKKIKYNFANNPKLKQKLSDLKRIRLYVTPFGVFTKALEASLNSNCSKATILKRCVKKTDKITGYNYQTPKEYKSDSKTWRDFGWFFIKLDNV